MSQLATPTSARNPTTNGTAAKGVALLPTNTVNTNDGVTVRARIDPTLTVEDVVRQLCINLKIRDSPAQYALRDENGELVTNDNLRKKIKAKQTLKYDMTPVWVHAKPMFSSTL
jgi:engulfment/cell motility protein 1